MPSAIPINTCYCPFPRRLPPLPLPSSSARTTSVVVVCSQRRPLDDELDRARIDQPRMDASTACLFDVGKVGIDMARSQQLTPTTDRGNIDGAAIATIKPLLR
ncbi:hypothetical protein ACLOJK_004533 [Asimina triloba]